MNNERETIEQILSLDLISENEEQTIFDIIPELKDEKGFPQNNPWHIYDVWDHTKKVVQSSKPYKDIRLVLLLHDIGKPHSYQDDENGTRHFREHSQKSAEISKTILERLGYTQEQIDEICFLIANHDKTIQPEVINASNLERYKKLLYIQYCDASGYKPEYIQSVYDKLDKISSYLKSMNNTIPAKIARRVIADILIERSNAIDDACDELIKKEMEGLGVVSDYAGELGWTACGTRVLADDVLEGIISLEEAITDILSSEERKEAKARCQKWLDNRVQYHYDKKCDSEVR